MEDLMLGIATNCLTAAMILWETTDLQCWQLPQRQRF